jgi:hypothetical protein
VGVVEAAGSGSGVDVLGPGVGLAAAVGEVDQPLAQPVVAAPAEHHVVSPTGRAGRGRDAGRGSQGVIGRVAAAGVADLSEQGRGADAAGAGQAGEYRRIGVRGQGELDARLERGDPFVAGW